DGLADAAERNLIAGNSVEVQIEGAGTDHNAVAGNYLGTDVTGTRRLTVSSTFGVYIVNGPQFNQIGTDGDGVNDAAEGNVIVGSGSYFVFAGVGIQGVGTDHNAVAGNLIGTDVTGTIALGNGQGVAIFAGARFNRVGGAVASQRNVI